ncbi:MAG: cation diffusion facilitator family transporter [Erysipelotrichaceae bacterium]|nr:cation diffusion facilitator family transporter [Erysipelotrichaceae bacterium]
MFDVLVRRLIKNYNDVESIKVREHYGTLCSILSIICNGIMVIFKLLFGYITGSVAIQADGFNNLSDMGSNLASLFGFKLASKHPDSEHPYGHGRYEYIMGLVISFLILMVALTSLKDSIVKIFYPESLTFTLNAVFVLLISIFMKLWMASFNKTAGNKIQSSTLLAASQDSLNDVITTSASLLSLCLCLVTDLPVDGVIGTIVSLIVLKSGIEIFKDTVDPLLGKAPDPELVEEIKNFVMSYEVVHGIHDLMLHDYGPGRKYMALHVEVNSKENIMHTHDCIDHIERDILQKYHILTTIHMDPLDLDDPLTNELKEKVIGVVQNIDIKYSIHDFRIVSGPTHTNLIFDVLVPSEDEISHAFLKKLINDDVKKIDSTYDCVIQVDHGTL